jgi:hypothetical protein
MLQWLIRKRIDAFERSFDYDMSYARELLAADARAFFAFAKVMAMSRYRRDVPRQVWFAAKLTGTIAEDCGPCTQLMVTMALREGVDRGTIAAIVAGRNDEMSDEVRLGVRFTEAVLRRVPEADALREEVLKRWGPRALVSLAFALTMSRVYPTLKYALGHGQACQRVTIAGEPLHVVRGAA